MLQSKSTFSYEFKFEIVVFSMPICDCLKPTPLLFMSFNLKMLWLHVSWWFEWIGIVEGVVAEEGKKKVEKVK